MSFASPFPQVQIPTTSLYDYLFGELADEDADRVALVDTGTGTETTYRDMIASIDAFAGALEQRGIGVGDVVGLLAPNSSGFAIAFHGILRAGATATTINALFTAKDVAKQLTDSHAKMLVTVASLLPQALEAAAAVGLTADKLVVLDGPGESVDGHANAADLLRPGFHPPAVTFDPATHLAALPYSSGTTANPKGVMLTHGNLAANVAQIRPIQAMGSDDRILAVLPFFHIYGMTVLLNAALHARARLVIMPSFDLAKFLGNIADQKCTYRVHRASGGRRPGQASARRALRPVQPAGHHVGGRAARRGPRPDRRFPAEVPARPGLRHERAQPGQPRHAVRRGS